MSAALAAKRPATVEDLYKVDGKAELVNGELVLMSPTGYLHGLVCTRLTSSLYAYEVAEGGGHAFGDNVAFVVHLPNRGSFAPDVAWYTGDPPEFQMDFVTGTPDFAVEVRSKEDYGRSAERELAQKRADYFAAGTLVVWDVDMNGEEVIRKYTSDNPEQALVYRRGEIADAEPAVPKWRLAVDALFM
jgi:Uma2 family endonuclease